MTTIERAGTITGGGVGILDRERTIAAAGYNRWLVPPAALCIHLCIGMAYGFSVFWLPIARGWHTRPRPAGHVACRSCSPPPGASPHGLMFTLLFVLLGVSAAIWGGWPSGSVRSRRRRGQLVGGLLIGRSAFTCTSRIMWLGPV